ncbi:MAG: hypothetical protein RMK79_07460 [Anaerolineae bacterium]|nr:hypothetical protein [Anaerolineae bacterium]
MTAYWSTKLEKYWRTSYEGRVCRETDILTIILSDALVAESDEDKPGVILD